MTHYSTLIQRCRRTNSLLADELSDEFHRLERENVNLRATVAECAAPFDQSNSPAVAGAMAGADELQKRIKVAAAALT